MPFFDKNQILKALNDNLVGAQSQIFRNAGASDPPTDVTMHRALMEPRVTPFNPVPLPIRSVPPMNIGQATLAHSGSSPFNQQIGAGTTAPWEFANRNDNIYPPNENLVKDIAKYKNMVDIAKQAMQEKLGVIPGGLEHTLGNLPGGKGVGGSFKPGPEDLE